MKKNISALLLLILSMGGRAQHFVERGVVRSETTIGIGQSALFDSYLSPLSYQGMGTLISYDRYYVPSFMPDEWCMEHSFMASAAIAYNSPATNMYLNGMLNYHFRLNYRLFTWNKIEAYVGATLGLYVGGISSSSNGNNPANLALGMDGGISYRLYYPLHLGKQQFEVRYEGAIPLVGTFFSPHFMEAYYSIFLVNGYGNNFVFAHPGNRRAIDHTFSIGWNIKRYQIKVGWIQQYKHTNEWNLTAERSNNYVTVGVSRRFSYK